MSLAMNRSEARRAVYLQQGQVTTGTVSPKNTVFQSGGQGQQLYKQWRGYADAHDPEKAKKMLDALGVVDKDGDGMRERPDGSKLTIRLDYPAGASQTFAAMIAQVKRDWTAIGIKVLQNPVPPTAYSDQWGQGQLMVNSGLWVEGTTAPLIDPQVLVPINGNFWAPLHGQAYTLQLSDKKTLTSQRDVSPWKRKPPFLVPADKMPIGSMVGRIWDLFARARVQSDPMKRLQTEWKLVKIHIDQGPLFYGVIANQPCIIIVHNGLTNVPERDQLALGGFTQPWVIPAPACYDPEVFAWDDPSQHTV
jgi:peptide/nickel transport system substrate-binding protein